MPKSTEYRQVLFQTQIILLSDEPYHFCFQPTSPSLSMPPIYELPIFDRHVCLQPTPKYTRGHSQMIRFRTTIGQTGGWKSFYNTRNRLLFILEPSEDQTDERRTYFLLRTLFGHMVEMYSPSYFRSAWRPHGWK